MNRTSSTNLYPMMVTPLDFKKGDVVKKIFTDKIVTPYTGIVTAIVPSTNKVEVQWPQSTAIEDPWDLIKVNPLIVPPVVKKDKSYNTYQNSQKMQKHIESLRHYNVLKEFIKEHKIPLVVMASNLYNEGISKSQAFKSMKEGCDNFGLIKETLDRVYNDQVNINKSLKISIDGKERTADLHLSGNSESGYTFSYALDGDKKEKYFDNIQTAIAKYRDVADIVENINNSNIQLSTIVSKVAKKTLKLDKENKDKEKEVYKGENARICLCNTPKGIEAQVFHDKTKGELTMRHVESGNDAKKKALEWAENYISEINKGKKESKEVSAKEFCIHDWAGNHLFKEKTFKTFEDAWDFIREKFPNEKDWEEYEVYEKGKK